MKISTVIAIWLYLMGAYQVGYTYHEKASENSFNSIYGRTVLIMIGWPILGFVTAQIKNGAS